MKAWILAYNTGGNMSNAASWPTTPSTPCHCSGPISVLSRPWRPEESPHLGRKSSSLGRTWEMPKWHASFASLLKFLRRFSELNFKKTFPSLIINSCEMCFLPCWMRMDATGGSKWDQSIQVWKGKEGSGPSDNNNLRNTIFSFSFSLLLYVFLSVNAF